MASEGVGRGILVTCGQFTLDAKAFVKGKHLELVDGAMLLEQISQVQESRNIDPIIAFEQKQSTFIDLNCPRCGKLMVIRKARKGKHIGKQFWGCTGFPQCRGIKEIP